MEKILLRTLGIVGAVFFTGVLVYSFINPLFIEKSAQSFIGWQLRHDVEQKVDQIDVIKGGSLGVMLNRHAAKLQEVNQQKIESFKLQLKAGLAQKLAAEIAKLNEPDCPCRKAIEQVQFEVNILSLKQTQAKLIEFSQYKYMEIVTKLNKDVRIFLGVNALAFFILLFISLANPRKLQLLYIPGILLFISTLIASYFYLFEQNWMYTILYSDYTGFGYLAYIIMIMAILTDIALNRGRVTAAMVNATCEVIGTAFRLVPC